jgi:hypothetical protein
MVAWSQDQSGLSDNALGLAAVVGELKRAFQMIAG